MNAGAVLSRLNLGRFWALDAPSRNTKDYVMVSKGGKLKLATRRQLAPSKQATDARGLH